MNLNTDLYKYFRKDKKKTKKSTMENKKEKEEKNVPKKVKIGLKKPVVIVPPRGNDGLRITIVIDSIKDFPKDTARLRKQSEKKLDSIRKSYE